jgi:S1-C subfamily serine protease
MKTPFRLKSISVGMITGLLISVIQPMIASALQGYEVSNIAKSITVSIEGTSTDPIRSGSGVVVSKEDRDGEHLYQVLTNWHVVDHEGEYWIKTLDAELHPVDYNQVKRVPNTDIAILQFRSQHIYSVAQIGDASQLIEGMTVFFCWLPDRIIGEV